MGDGEEEVVWMQNNEKKTPYFLIDEESLDNNFQYLRESLESTWGNYIIGYSYKTNALPWVINHFKKLLIVKYQSAFSCGFVVIIEYSSVSFGKRSVNGNMVLP